MKQFFSLCCLLAIFAIGCANPDESVKSNSLVTTFTSWPACASTAGNPETTVTMNDSRDACTSCDLVAPCTNPVNSSVTYSWYSPKICSLCAAHCMINTAVGSFCAQAYSGATGPDKNSYYIRVDTTKSGFYDVFSSSTHAAYGSYPTSYCGDGEWTQGSGGSTFSFPVCPTQSSQL